MDDTSVHSLDRVPTENYRSYAPLDVSITDEKQRPFLYVEGGEVAHRMMVSIWNRDPNGETITLPQPSTQSIQSLEEYRAIAPFADLLDTTPEARTAALAKMNTETRTKAEARLKQFKGYGGGRIFYYIGKFFEENHHFELRFASPVLSKETKNWLLRSLLRAMSRHTIGEDLWYICPAPNPRGPDAPDRLLLMAANARADLQPQGSASAPPDLRIALAHIATVSEVEAQVIPIELRPGPLTRRATDFARLGPSIQLMEVQSQVGQRFVPLHFSTVGADQVINDDTEETFVLLRLSNIDRENAISLDRVGNLQTVFSLSCELTKPGSREDWALSDEPAKVQLWVKPIAGPGDPAPDPDNPDDWLEDPLIGHSDGRHLVWEFDGHYLGDVPLSPDASVYMRLSVITRQRTGPAALHLKYRHIPGYWDGVRQINITKSPLVADWNHDASDNRVGIGTAKPGSKLGVTEGVSVGAHYASDVLAPPNGMAVEGSVVIGADTPNKYAQLHVEGGRIHLNQPNEAAVVELSNGKRTNYVYTDGGHGNLYLTTDSAEHHMLLQPHFGHVGIGIPDTPKHPLEVAGRIKGVLDGEDILKLTIEKKALEQAVQNALCPIGSIMPFAADEAPKGWLMCDGTYYFHDKELKPLFEKIGHRFGKALRSPELFRVPDLRGLFLRGRSGTESYGVDPDKDDRGLNRAHQMQGAVGNNVGSIQGDAIAAHEHTYAHTTGKNPLGNKEGSLHFSVDKRVEASTTEGGKDKKGNDKVGFNGGKETRPRNMYVNFIIKF
jgi:microcystin-dependent protein